MKDWQLNRILALLYIILGYVIDIEIADTFCFITGFVCQIISIRQERKEKKWK